MPVTKKPRSTNSKQRVASTGADVVAGTAGTAAATGAAVLLGPFALLLGPAVSVAVRRLLEMVGADRVFIEVRDDWIGRQLGTVERDRLNATWSAFVDNLNGRLESGEKIRDDGFFSERREEDNRSPAADLLDGVLVRARDSYEQRKAQRLGELLAFLVTHPDISPGHAHHLLRLTDRLTYQQLLFLGALAQRDRFSLPDWTSTGAMTWRETGTVSVLLELAHEELLVRADHRAVQSFTDINPSQLRPALNGTILVEAMNLEEAEEEDWIEVLDALRRLGTVDVEAAAEHMETVVPTGADPEVKRVRLGHRTVRFPPMATGLSDIADAPEERGISSASSDER